MLTRTIIGILYELGLINYIEKGLNLPVVNVNDCNYLVSFDLFWFCDDCFKYIIKSQEFMSNVSIMATSAIQNTSFILFETSQMNIEYWILEQANWQTFSFHFCDINSKTKLCIIWSLQINEC